MDEYDGHKNLRGLDRRSLIPYIHGREVLYCCVLFKCLSGSEFACHLHRPFITQSAAVTL
jgi:hypothetical protein